MIIFSAFGYCFYMNQISFRALRYVCLQNCSYHYVPKFMSKRTHVFKSLLNILALQFSYPLYRWKNWPKFNVFVDYMDLIFEVFQYSELVLLIAFNGGCRYLSHWKKYILKKCYMQNTYRKGRKLFIQRKKSVRSKGSNYSKNECKNPTLLYRTAVITYYLMYPQPILSGLKI